MAQAMLGNPRRSHKRNRDQLDTVTDSETTCRTALRALTRFLGRDLTKLGGICSASKIKGCATQILVGHIAVDDVPCRILWRNTAEMPRDIGISAYTKNLLAMVDDLENLDGAGIKKLCKGLVRLYAHHIYKHDHRDVCQALAPQLVMFVCYVMHVKFIGAVVCAILLRSRVFARHYREFCTAWRHKDDRGSTTEWWHRAVEWWHRAAADADSDKLLASLEAMVEVTNRLVREAQKNRDEEEVAKDLAEDAERLRKKIPLPAQRGSEFESFDGLASSPPAVPHTHPPVYANPPPVVPANWAMREEPHNNHQVGMNANGDFADAPSPKRRRTE